MYFTVFIVQITKIAGTSDTAFHANGKQALLQTMNAEVAFFGRIFMSRVRFSGAISAGLCTVHAMNTFVIVNHDDAVLRTLVGCLDRTDFYAGRILAVVALIGKRDHDNAVVVF